MLQAVKYNWSGLAVFQKWSLKRANQNGFFLTVHRLSVTGVDCLLPLKGYLFLIAYCHMTEMIPN